MDGFIDHYTVLGLPSGEESSKLTKEEISKAYKVKALELHPDKRPDDPNAHDKFQSLNASYKILKDEKERAIFDAKLSSKRAQQRTQILRDSKRDAKRQKMVSDLDRAEARAAASAAQDKVAEEERRERRFKEDLERIRATIAKEQAEAAAAAAAASFSVPKRETSGVAKELDKEKEKVLKVSWEKVGEGYTAARLRFLFSRFGEVEDIVTKDSKKRGRALVVMATKDAAAAARTFSGDPPNSLLIEPLEPVAAPTDTPPVHKSDKPEPVSSSQVGGDHQVFEGHQRFRDAVLKKLQKAAQKQQVSDF